MQGHILQDYVYDIMIVNQYPGNHALRITVHVADAMWASRPQHTMSYFSMPATH